MLTLNHERPVEVAYAVDKGLQRANNEDCAIALDLTMRMKDTQEATGVYAVADGMGGAECGEVASELALKTATQHIMQKLTRIHHPDAEQYQEWLASAIQFANRVVYGEEPDMGTTLVMAIVTGSEAHIASVGDSRAYIITDDKITQITEDQTVVRQLINAGVITPEQAENHPYKNVLEQALGLDTSVDVELHTVEMDKGYYLLLCSDGLTNELNDQVIHRLVTHADSIQEACDTLIDAANASGGRDNISVMLVHMQ